MVESLKVECVWGVCVGLLCHYLWNAFRTFLEFSTNNNHHVLFTNLNHPCIKTSPLSVFLLLRLHSLLGN